MSGRKRSTHLDQMLSLGTSFPHKASERARMDVTVPGLTAAQLATLQQWATDTPRVAAMTVFGSRARGTHHPASDVDIAIDLTEGSDDTAGWLWFDRRETWNAELSALVGLDVRLVRLTDDDDGGIGQGLSDDGITVFRI